MSNINLLPWREAERAQQKRKFLGLLGLSAALGVVLSGGLYFHYQQQVDGQQTRNAYLEDKIKAGEKKIEAIKELENDKQRLLGRKTVIEALQSDRARIVRLFETLSRSTPDGVVLTLVKQNDQGMLIEGRAQSNTRVSNYMRALEESGWMKNPDLDIIEAAKPEPGFEAFPYQFKLSVGLAKTEEVAQAQAEAAALAGAQAVQDQTLTDPDLFVELKAAPAAGEAATGEKAIDAPSPATTAPATIPAVAPTPDVVPEAPRAPAAEEAPAPDNDRPTQAPAPGETPSQEATP